MSIALLLQSFARSHPDSPALVDGAFSLSYTELEQRATAAAGFLRQKQVLPGHVVCIGLAPADPWTWVFLLGAWRVGAVPALLGARPAEQIRAIGGRGAVVLAEEGAALLRLPDIRPVAVSAKDKLSLVATKGVVGLVDPAVADARAGLVVFGSGSQLPSSALDHFTVMARADMLGTQLGLDSGSRLLAVLPAGASAKAELAVAVWQRGGALVLAPAQPADGGDAGGPGWTHLLLTPPALKGMLQLKGLPRSSATRRIVVLGGPLGKELIDACTQSFGATPEQWLYSNECGVYAAGDSIDLQSHPGCVGRLLDGVTAQFLDRRGAPAAPGESALLVVRTPWMARGYLHGRPENVALGLHGDAYRTGLVARLENDDRLTVQGLVAQPSAPPAKSAGRLWSRGELESAVSALSGVREACVLSQAATQGRAGVPAIVYVAADESAEARSLEPRVKALLGEGQRFHLIQVPTLPRAEGGAVDRERLAAAVTQAIENARKARAKNSGAAP